MKELPAEETILILGAVLLVAALFSIQFVLSPFSEQPSGQAFGRTCYDSDGGKTPSISGSGYQKSLTTTDWFSDVCTSDYELSEFYCDSNDRGQYIKYDCRAVTKMGICSNNRCPKGYGESCSNIVSIPGQCIDGYHCAKDIGTSMKTACCPLGYCWVDSRQECTNKDMFTPGFTALYRCDGSTYGGTWRWVSGSSG